MNKEVNSRISNQDRIRLVYQAVISLEAQTWALLTNKDSLNAALHVLEAVEKAIDQKYPESLKGDRNAR